MFSLITHCIFFYSLLPIEINVENVNITDNIPFLKNIISVILFHEIKIFGENILQFRLLATMTSINKQSADVCQSVTIIVIRFDSSGSLLAVTKKWPMAKTEGLARQ